MLSPRMDADKECTWGSRKLWGMERWIWIVIGTGTLCLLFACLVYLVGRGDGGGGGGNYGRPWGWRGS